MIYPALLEFRAPRLNAGPPETVGAEKFQGMVPLGRANSRMKDFYDVEILALTFYSDGTGVGAAIRATFGRRQTSLPATTLLALTAEFGADRMKAIQWGAFLSKGRLINSPPPPKEVVDLLASFLTPPTLALASSESSNRTWVPTEWRQGPGATSLRSPDAMGWIPLSPPL